MPDETNRTPLPTPAREIGERLEEAERVVVASHQRPDGDAIGSAVAMGRCLELLGKEVTIINEDGTPSLLRILDPDGLVKRADELPDTLEADVWVILDTAERGRVGAQTLSRLADGIPCANIDHHVSNPGYADLNWVEPSAPATGQLVYQLATGRGWPLDTVACNALFAAISTDTGCFRYPSTTAATYRIGAALIEAGVDVGMLSSQLYERYPQRRLHLLRQLMERLDLRANGRLASWRLPLAVSEALGLEATDQEGLIDQLRAVEDVLVAVCFEELADGKVRVSARSKAGGVDVGEICQSFGGGGHTLAAGARLPGPLDEAAERFLAKAEAKIHGTN